MKNIYTNIYTFNKKILKKTVKSLNQGNIIGLPTETVYGLAGNAYSKKSINKIFKLKKRPIKNPLIIHYHSIKRAYEDVIFNDNFLSLYRKFCPGPITFVLKKKEKSRIHNLASADLDTVAIRFPNHNLIRSILKVINFPLAMPSANISSYLSPVSAYDVFDEFKKKLDIIINGGQSKIGIESTVVDLTSKPRILRPGIISPTEIKKNLRIKLSKKKTNIKSPGMMKKHYSPGIPVILGKKPTNQKHAYIVFGNKFANKGNYFNLSKKSDLKEAASKLYKTMRAIKKSGFKKIFVSKIPNYGIGIAINDRIKRSAK